MKALDDKLNQKAANLMRRVLYTGMRRGELFRTVSMYDMGVANCQARRKSMTLEQRKQIITEAAEQRHVEFQGGETKFTSGTGHVALYNRVNLIPFDKLDSFFKANMIKSGNHYIQTVRDRH